MERLEDIFARALEIPDERWKAIHKKAVCSDSFSTFKVERDDGVMIYYRADDFWVTVSIGGQVHASKGHKPWVINIPTLIRQMELALIQIDKLRGINDGKV